MAHPVPLELRVATGSMAETAPTEHQEQLAQPVLTGPTLRTVWTACLAETG